MSDAPIPDRFAEGFGADERPPCQLYLISPSAFALAAHSRALEAVLAASGPMANGPVAAYQLRLKGSDDDSILAAAGTLAPICAAHDVAFILNDRADLAARCAADGVHLGQGDGSVKAARTLMGHDAQIGVTCHGSRHLAMEAGDAGASYVAFGAFYDTGTKVVEHRAELEIIRWWTAISPIPCVAIGGITADNCSPLVEAGADFLAVSAAVWSGVNPVAAVRDLAEAMARAG